MQLYFISDSQQLLIDVKAFHYTNYIFSSNESFYWVAQLLSVRYVECGPTWEQSWTLVQIQMVLLSKYMYIFNPFLPYKYDSITL